MTSLQIDKGVNMTDTEWEKLLEEEARYLELEWEEWNDELDYYQVCRDS